MYIRIKRKRTTIFLTVEPSDTVLEVKQKLQALLDKVSVWGSGGVHAQQRDIRREGGGSLQIRGWGLAAATAVLQAELGSQVCGPPLSSSSPAVDQHEQLHSISAAHALCMTRP